MAHPRQQLLETVRRRLDDETGTLVKVAPLSVALCYPSPYHVGMSSLGFQAIYRGVHAHPSATAERVFLPDDLDAWRAARLPPVSVETQRPLAQFPVLAFSVAYELELSGLFELLSLAGIEPKREARDEAAPLIVAGGPLTFSNAEPLAPFVDVLVQGEAEDLLPQLLDEVLSGASKSTVTWMNPRGLVDWEQLTVGSTVLKREYDYSQRRHLVASSDTQNTYGYGFDSVGLPTSVTRNGSTKWLAESGNTLTVGTVTYGFDGLHRTISRRDVAAPAEDLTLAYGPDGQLETASRGGVSFGYVHDEAGQRLMKLKDGAPVAAYLEEGYLDATGLTERFQVGGRTVGVVKNGVFTTVATDLRGSVLAETTGEVRVASPFGQRDVHTAMSAAIEYVEKGYDADLGLVRMGVRDYDPETNRFTTADPLFLESPAKCVESPGQCALYTYTQGDPLSFVDPSGLAITDAEANARLAEIDATAGGDLHPSCILAPSSFPEQATAMRDTLRGLGELRMETAAAQWEQGNWASAALHYAVGHVASSLSEYYNPNWSVPLITGGLNVRVPGPAIEGDAAKGTGAPREPSSPGKLQKEVERGQAPKEVQRVDKPHIPKQEPHVHFCNGTSCNRSGTTHDAHKGAPDPSKQTREWLEGHGWTPPPK